MAVVDSTCSVDGCERPSAVKTYCRFHYHRVYTGLPLIPETHAERTTRKFWASVRKTNGCWIWTRTTCHFGYGSFYPFKQSHVRAHRYAYELAHGPIPDGLWVLHKCDNPPCVRPDHLYLGNAADNASDRVNRGRGTSGSQCWPKHRKRGEELPASKVTEDIVRRIRAEHNPPLVTNQGLATRYGISKEQVWKIRKGRCWGHVK